MYAKVYSIILQYVNMKYKTYRHILIYEYVNMIQSS